MSKKSLNCLLFLLTISFLGFNSILAYTCKYSGDGLNISFDVNKDNTTTTANSSGNFSSEPVLNWNSAIQGTKVNGHVYGVGGACPKYLVAEKMGILFKWDELYISDAEDLKAIKNFNTNQANGYPKVLTLIEQPKQEQTDEKVLSSCLDFDNKKDCEYNDSFSCIWVTDVKNHTPYCNVDKLLYVSCGNAYNIPKEAPQIVSFAVTFLKVLVPIILVLVSVITLLKAVGASKEDEIKKAQSSLVKKIIASVMAFFVITIVQFVILKVADYADQDGISKCLSCFLNNDCSDNIYYKTHVLGEDYCTTLGGTRNICPND